MEDIAREQWGLLSQFVTQSSPTCLLRTHNDRILTPSGLIGRKKLFDWRSRNAITQFICKSLSASFRFNNNWSTVDAGTSEPTDAGCCASGPTNSSRTAIHPPA